jgi:predicted N-acetyltransferase YhbS
MARIALLSDHLKLLNDLARALEREWPQWYGVRGDAMTDLRERARPHGLPVGLVAVEGDTAVGTIALAAQGAASHPELSPWIIGLWVEPARRRSGIGSNLLDAACAEARAAGYRNVYTSTVTSARLVERLGWTKIAVGTAFGGDTVEIFKKALD